MRGLLRFEDDGLFLSFGLVDVEVWLEVVDLREVLHRDLLVLHRQEVSIRHLLSARHCGLWPFESAASSRVGSGIGHLVLQKAGLRC